MDKVTSQTFRIGNLIYDLDKPVQTPLEVIILAKNTIEVYDEPTRTTWRVWEPRGIPLTAEWLTKLGFEVRDDNPKQKLHYEGDVLVTICNHEFSNSMRDGFYSYSLNVAAVTYKYVHEIQNLYYALTGIELTSPK